MNERLKQIRLENRMSQEEFGRKIGIESRAHISALEKGNRNITDRIVNDVCREFNINEDWLRYGTGPMCKEIEDKLSSYLGEIAIGNDDFIKEIIEIYMELDQTSKDTLKKISKEMANIHNKRREQK